MADENTARIVKPTVVLQAVEYKLRASITAPDASPFLGHHELEDAQKGRAFNALHALTNTNPERFIQLFRGYPLFCCWVIATAVAESYGEGGDTRIYELIQRKGGFTSLSPAQRKQLNQAFRRPCLRHGLPVVPQLNEGNDSFVDDYIVQAGVAHNQLKHLASAFLRADQELGPAPIDDTVQLSDWAKEAAHQFMSENLPRPRRVIDHDNVGFHAAAYVRVDRSQAADTIFEQAFSSALVEAKRTSTASANLTPRLPLLNFSDGEMSLENPNSGLGMVVSIDGRGRYLAPGARVGIASPWPALATFRIGEGAPTQMGIIEADELLAFDPGNGRLIRRIRPDALSATLDAIGVVLVCSHPFTVASHPSQSVGQQAYALYVALDQSVRVDCHSRQIALSMGERPRLSIEGQLIAMHSGTALLANVSSVRIFATPDLLSQKLVVRVEHSALAAPIDLDVSATEIGEHRATIEHLPFQGVFNRLKLSLFIKGQQRPLAKTFVWYWPGLLQLNSGVVFDGPVPENFDTESSRHVEIGVQGKIELVDSGDYLTANLGFVVDGVRVILPIPRPGLTLSVAIPNFPERPIAVGTDFIVSDSLDGSLVIRTSDQSAWLDVCGREERNAFLGSGVRRISIASFLSREAHNRVRYIPKGDLALAHDILTVVGATDPETYKCTVQTDNARVGMRLRVPIDAVRLEFQSVESSEIIVTDIQLGRRPVERRALPAITYSQSGADRQDVTLRIDVRGFRRGEWLGSIRVREEGNDEWRPITNQRLDEYSFAFHGHREEPGQVDEMRRFLLLDQVLTRCFAAATWASIEQVIVPAWRAAGARLKKTTDGPRCLLRATGHSPPSMASTSWVPICHPLELAPDLFECHPGAFVDLADATAEGAAHYAQFGKLEKCTRIRDARVLLNVNPVFFMGFPNLVAAEQSENIRLKNFSFSRYEICATHPSVEFDPNGTFWGPRKDWLTMAHHSWCCARIVERIRRVSPDGSMANHNRMPGAAHLASVISQLPRAGSLAAPEALTNEFAFIEHVGPALSAFAYACRHKTSMEFLQLTSTRASRSISDVTRSMGFVLRIAPELFTFYLILWELVAMSEK